MICAIPYKDYRNGEELRFAIRSIVKNIKFVNEIVLIGDKPDWYTGLHIPCEDHEGRKEFSIYYKLMQITMITDKPVFYSNDDYYYLKPFTNFPNYYNGTCGGHRSLDRTYRELYNNCQPDWKNFDVHTGMIINPKKFTWEIDRPIKTYYANQNNLEGEQMSDCKIRGDQIYSDIKYMIEGRGWFSSHSNAHYEGMNKMLSELFSEKTKYEL